MLLTGNRKRYILLNFHRYKLLSCTGQNFLDIEREYKSVTAFQLQKKQLRNQSCKCLYCLFLDDLPKNPQRNFKLKICLFGSTNITKYSNKSKQLYTDYGIAFDGAGFWSFGNDFARNLVTFGIDNSSSCHADNQKNNFSVLGEGPTYYINESFSAAEQKFSINFTKSKTNIRLSFHYNGDNSYLSAKGKEIYKFKADNTMVNFPSQFCLKRIFNGFGAT